MGLLVWDDGGGGCSMLMRLDDLGSVGVLVGGVDGVIVNDCVGERVVGVGGLEDGRVTLLKENNCSPPTSSLLSVGMLLLLLSAVVGSFDVTVSSN